MSPRRADPGSGEAGRPRVEVSSEAPAGWDEFTLTANGGTFCHLAGWGSLMGRTLRLNPLFLTAWGDGAIRGVLPLFRMPRLGRGHVLISVPYLNYGGPLGDPAAQESLVGRALEAARQGGARRLEIRARSPLPSALHPGREKITVLLDLPHDPEVLFNQGFKAKLRSQIRRPQKEGMEARFGPDQAGPFHRVFAHNMRDLGTPVLPRSFFEGMVPTFGDQVEFGAIYHRGLPVAAGCGFHFGGEFEMTWASSLREANQLAPNMLLYWSFMERCIGKGRKVFNFGRCTPGGGTHRFKAQWGGREQTLPWLQWPEATTTESPEAGPFRLATRLWRRLPLPVANRVGPLLARRIPTF